MSNPTVKSVLSTFQGATDIALEAASVVKTPIESSADALNLWTNKRLSDLYEAVSDRTGSLVVATQEELKANLASADDKKAVASALATYENALKGYLVPSVNWGRLFRDQSEAPTAQFHLNNLLRSYGKLRKQLKDALGSELTSADVSGSIEAVQESLI